jgi:hypothetical protein
MPHKPALKVNRSDPRRSQTYRLSKAPTPGRCCAQRRDASFLVSGFIRLARRPGEADLLIDGACHNEKRTLRTAQPVVDVSGFPGLGST